jgi:hypothetical protein
MSRRACQKNIFAETNGTITLFGGLVMYFGIPKDQGFESW